jgi:DNA-3-methyladenine glycosylase I
MNGRCPWGIEADSLYLAYHDQEWRVPSHDDRALFELLVLEGAQAGLSWPTILRKCEAMHTSGPSWGGRPKQNHFRRLADLPAETAESRAMSKDLKRRRFRFVGPTICYAFMQAAGLVNDRLVGCFRYREISTLR